MSTDRENRKESDKMYYILKLGDLYISNICIENYNTDIRISFTAHVDDAKKFNDLNCLTFKNIIELLLNCELTTLCVNEDYDKEFII